MRKQRLVLAVACCCGAGMAQAQVSGSVVLVSNYLYRGITLSESRPAAQVNLSYDSADGWFMGAFASRIRNEPARGASIQSIVYGGYAQRLSSGLSWETGLAQHVYTGAPGSNYRELHLGLSSEQVSARISYAPRYLGMHSRSLYAEINASHPLSEDLSVFGHLGYLGYLPGSPAFLASYRNDVRIGLATGLAGWKLQLAWDAGHVAAADQPQYNANVHSRRGLVFSAAKPF